MTCSLAKAMCDGNLVKGYAEVRKFINAKAVTVNGKLAVSWNQIVQVGDVIKLGKYRTYVVR